MNVLKPNLKTTVITLLEKGISQREINRKTGINRKTIRRYAHLYHQASSEDAEHSNYPTLEKVATDSSVLAVQNTPPRPPVVKEAHRKTFSACEAHRRWIEEQLRLGRNAMSIYQDLVELFGFTHRYNSVKRFVRRLKQKDPHQFDRLEFRPGEEAQVDYGTGAPTLHDNGKYRRPRLFVMVLKYSGRAFRKVVWKSSKETWCRLHEEAFRYFGGCPDYVALDNLKEGVIKPDIYDPELNALYAAMLSHYDVTADPARVKDPNRKGTVENGVKYTQNTGLKGRKFDNIEVQNDWLRHWEKRWASCRIHGRAKRQVEEMYKEERPYLQPLPLSPFVYFHQETRTVYDDGTIQLDNCYYAANPAPLHSKVVVRVYDKEIEILNPERMEVIRRHPKGRLPGSLMMEPGERIFNPSRQTDQLLARAEAIGPHTFSLCETWFKEEGRTGQRRMYGLVNLVRHYPSRYVEKAAELAKKNDLRSSKAIRRMVERMVKDAEEKGTERLTQDHPLIRSGKDYGLFWDQHAAGGTSSPSKTISRNQFPQVWEQASWLEVIKVFGLEVDHKRSRRDDEIWVKSPFTREEKASMHLSLSENIFKDFSSGKGGGIMQFCREMLRQKGRAMTMVEVGQWMVTEGISMVHHPQRPSVTKQREQKAGANPAMKIDLRRYLRTDHPELHRRGISSATCRYLGCGFLPKRTWTKKESPLNARLVFQVRGLKENGHGLEPIILSHTGRALSFEQEDRNGKYWSYPFKKSWEIYNQDNILLDEEARHQTKKSGLVLTEGFFDVAKLVEAGLRNVAAIMGSSISPEQIKRLRWIHERVGFPRVLLFPDRDKAGIDGFLRIQRELSGQDFSVTMFDWDQRVSLNGHGPQPIPKSIKDPADMSVEQLQTLHRQGII
jgi:transposase/5S rRNA maturation endonuclease (ribonuclease M5)